VRTVIVAHAGRPLAPHELWTAWDPAPLVVGGLVLLAWVHWRGRTRTRAGGTWRARCFAGGLVSLGVALLSPLDPLSDVLASAHMVQHLLLVLVAAPLLALSAPAGALLRGSPAVVRSSVTSSRRRLRLTVRAMHALRNPAVVWLLHVATLWLWHAAVLYGAALEHPLVHALEHTTFLVTGVLFWRVVVGARAVRVSPGLGVLLVFGMTLQSSLLALLLTFARTPWYPGYTATTRPWGLEQLADQQLAGAIMWVPAGFVYLGVALALLVGWVRDTEQSDPVTTADVPTAASSRCSRDTTGCGRR
jgi:putative membrane protein